MTAEPVGTTTGNLNQPTCPGASRIRRRSATTAPQPPRVGQDPHGGLLASTARAPPGSRPAPDGSA